jgi:DNA polymerase
MSALVTIDIESFYDRDFSLSKISTEEYVRSDKFETIGLSVKHGDGPTQWYPQSEVAPYLASVDWSDKFIIAQNTAFDGAILKWRYGVNPKGWLDTLGMSRALYPHAKSHSLKSQAERHGIGVKGTEVINALGKRYVDFSPIELARYAEYCCNDTELTYALFNTYMGMGFPRIELQLIDLTLRMFIDPVLRLDKPVLQSHLAEVKEIKANLLDNVRDMMLADGDPDFTHQVFTEGTDGIKKLLMSNDKFAEVLRRFGVEPPTKISLTTGKEAYAFAKTDEAFKALEEHPSVEVQGLVAARLGNKSTLEETRTERFIGMADRGQFPVPLRYYGAHSGRWSGQDFVNLQNLPSRGANAGKIKKAIVAPLGYVVIDCDSSQIEARTLAWLAGQDDLIQAFENKEDVYKIMASRIYNVPVVEITPGQRQVGKVVILGAGYGVGHVKLQAFLKQQAKVEVSLEEAKRIIDAYRATYFRIPMLWKSAGNALKALALEQAMQIDVPGIVKVAPGKGLTLPNGLFIQYPDLKRVITKSLQGEEKQQWSYQSKGLPVYVYGGKVVENFCQAVARCVVAEQMLRIAKRYKVVLTVHDAIAVVVKQEEAAEAKAYVEACMSWRPKWAPGLPLACESGLGASYGDC